MNIVTAEAGTLYIMTFVAEKPYRLDNHRIYFPEVGQGEHKNCKKTAKESTTTPKFTFIKKKLQSYKFR